MPRQRDIPDDADEKWVYTQHTAAKHEILHRYLGAWLAILGRARKGSGWRHKQLVLVDAFAGRGRYMGGEMVRYAGASSFLPPFTAPVG